MKPHNESAHAPGTIHESRKGYEVQGNKEALYGGKTCH